MVPFLPINSLLLDKHLKPNYIKSEKRINEADAVHSSLFYSLAKYPEKQIINYEDCIYVNCFLSEDYSSSKKFHQKVDQSVV